MHGRPWFAPRCPCPKCGTQSENLPCPTSLVALVWSRRSASGFVLRSFQPSHCHPQVELPRNNQACYGKKVSRDLKNTSQWKSKIHVWQHIVQGIGGLAGNEWNDVDMLTHKSYMWFSNLSHASVMFSTTWTKMDSKVALPTLKSK